MAYPLGRYGEQSKRILWWRPKIRGNPEYRLENSQDLRTLEITAALISSTRFFQESINSAHNQESRLFCITAGFTGFTRSGSSTVARFTRGETSNIRRLTI